MYDTINVNYSRFKQMGSDIDFIKSERAFSGRLTRGRYKRLSRFARLLSGRVGYCGHEHDCCGCLSSRYAEFTYKHNQVVFTITSYHNY